MALATTVWRRDLSHRVFSWGPDGCSPPTDSVIHLIVAKALRDDISRRHGSWLGGCRGGFGLAVALEVFKASPLRAWRRRRLALPSRRTSRLPQSPSASLPLAAACVAENAPA